MTRKSQMAVITKNGTENQSCAFAAAGADRAKVIGSMKGYFLFADIAAVPERGTCFALKIRHSSPCFMKRPHPDPHELP